MKKMLKSLSSLRSIVISGPRVQIGRSEQNDYVIADRHISKQHADVTERHGEFYLCDLNSTNGTFLNNEQIDPMISVRLCIGDHVMLPATDENVYVFVLPSLCKNLERIFSSRSAVDQSDANSLCTTA